MKQCCPSSKTLLGCSLEYKNQSNLTQNTMKIHNCHHFSTYIQSEVKHDNALCKPLAVQFYLSSAWSKLIKINYLTTSFLQKSVKWSKENTGFTMLKYLYTMLDQCQRHNRLVLVYEWSEAQPFFLSTTVIWVFWCKITKYQSESIYSGVRLRIYKTLFMWQIGTFQDILTDHN